MSKSNANKYGAAYRQPRLQQPHPNHYKAQVVHLRELMRMTSDLDARIPRVFLGCPGVTKTSGQNGIYDRARKKALG